MWALHNIRLDREERLEDLEWGAILGGSFTNPEMAGKVIEAKRAREAGAPVEMLEEEVRRVARERTEGGKAPAADDDVRQKILSRSGDDTLMTLSDIAKKIEEEDGRS